MQRAHVFQVKFPGTTRAYTYLHTKPVAVGDRVRIEGTTSAGRGLPARVVDLGVGSGARDTLKYISVVLARTAKEQADWLAAEVPRNLAPEIRHLVNLTRDEQGGKLAATFAASSAKAVQAAYDRGQQQGYDAGWRALSEQPSYLSPFRQGANEREAEPEDSDRRGVRAFLSLRGKREGSSSLLG